MLPFLFFFPRAEQHVYFYIFNNLKTKIMERNVANMQSINDVLASLKVIKISGIVSEITEGRDADSTVFTLELDTPLPRVSSSLAYDIDGVKQKLTLEDVDYVKVHQSSLIGTDNFLFNKDTQEFVYEGDELRKDISGIGEAWLVKKTFAELSREGMNKRSADRNALRKSKFVTGAKTN